MPTVEEGTGAIIPDPVRLSRLAFRWRYTLAEQIAIDRATLEHPDPDVRSTLRILAASLAEAADVDVEDARTRQGVEYHATLGLIDPTRVPEILSAP